MLDRVFSGKSWYWLVFGSAFFLGLLVSMPHILHVLDERYEGIPVHFNSDEFGYLPRVQEALLGFGDTLGTAVTGGEEKLPELQAAFIERIYGNLFRPFHIRAATVFTIMDAVLPFLFMLVAIGFCQSCGFSRKQAFAIACLFSLLELYNLGRPIHQRASFLLVLVSLWAILSGLRHRMLWGVIGGILMGVLLDVYFWSWTAAWAWWAILLFLFFLEALGMRSPKRKQMSSLKEMLFHYLRIFQQKADSESPWKPIRYLALFGLIGIAVAAPAVFQMFSTSTHVFYDDVFFRSGIGRSHTPESWPWSILFFFMALGTSVAWYRRRCSTAVACMVITAFIILNQHVIHGVRFLFASHYLFFLVFAALFALVSLWRDRHILSLAGSIAALIFLAGIGYDNRSVIPQWRVDAGDFKEQHFASSLSVLDELPRSVILSDSVTSSFIASYTHHDVVFTNYIQHELRSHQELAERYCLTQIPLAFDDRHPEDEVVLIYGAAYDAIDSAQEKNRVQQEELDLVTMTCGRIEENITGFIEKYRVEYVFWDEKRQPKWNVKKMNVKLLKQGEGWSLWQMRA